MSRRPRALLLGATSLLSLSLLGAACSGKVDREGTKKLILKQLASADVSTGDAQCVAKLLDDYTDKELTQLDDEFKKSETPSSDLGKAFQQKLFGCMKGTTVTKMIESLKTSYTLTAEQEKCASDLVNNMTGDELAGLSDQAKASDFAANLVSTCQIKPTS